MNIKQFRYSLDNLGYLVYGRKEAIAIDGGAVNSLMSFVENKDLVLKYATNTHSHADHTMGTMDLVEKLNSEYLDYPLLIQEKKILIENHQIDVLATPGHTLDSVCFYTGDCLITGDTLFNGTVGNCFSGDIDGFYQSIKLLLSYPENTIVYAGHDYVKASIAVARQFEPNNREFDNYLKKYDPENVCSTLEDECKVNPYIRFNEQTIMDILKRKGLPVDTEMQRWHSVMKL